MINFSNIWRDVEFKFEVSNDIIIYAGKPQKDFFYQYVCLYEHDFYEPLSERVNLMEFAEKVSQLSITFVIMFDNNVVGMIASYFYDIESRKGFITLVHIKKEYRGKYFAHHLIEAVKNYARINNVLYIDLVVYKDNVAALNLYLSSGFTVFYEESGRCTLRCVINN